MSVACLRPAGVDLHREGAQAALSTASGGPGGAQSCCRGSQMPPAPSPAASLGSTSTCTQVAERVNAACIQEDEAVGPGAVREAVRAGRSAVLASTARWGVLGPVRTTLDYDLEQFVVAHLLHGARRLPLGTGAHTRMHVHNCPSSRQCMLSSLRRYSAADSWSRSPAAVRLKLLPSSRSATGRSASRRARQHCLVLSSGEHTPLRCPSSTEAHLVAAVVMCAQASGKW